MRPTALAAALDRVGDRWSLLLVDALLAGPHRFNDLLALLPGLASNVLSRRLRDLEAAGVVVARPYTRTPTRYAYELTESGGALADALRLLAQWGAGLASAGGSGTAAAPVRHQLCGTPVEARWWCPTCERVADPEDTGGLDHA